MKKYGVIDIGTNSVLLLIGELGISREIQSLKEDLRVTRIGKGVNETRLLRKDRMINTLEVLKEYIKECKKSGVEKIKVIGTSALRDAENSNDFLNLVKEETGVNVEILSGIREAELSFSGAISGIKDDGLGKTVIDIGGGSTEVVFGKGIKPEYFKSFEIGSIRMTEQFLKSDPPGENEIKEMRNFIKNSLSIFPKSLKTRLLIGVAGTVTTLAQISLKLPLYDRLQIENYKMQISNLEEIISLLKERNLEERKKIAGLLPERADVIVAGAIILEEIMNYFGFNEVIVSTRGLRYGVMMEMAERK